jgi:hypothetical protein
MRPNIKLLVASICVVAGVVILWQIFWFRPAPQQQIVPGPTIAVVGEPPKRPTLVVPTTAATEP